MRRSSRGVKGNHCSSCQGPLQKGETCGCKALNAMKRKLKIMRPPTITELPDAKREQIHRARVALITQMRL